MAAPCSEKALMTRCAWTFSCTMLASTPCSLRRWEPAVNARGPRMRGPSMQNGNARNSSSASFPFQHEQHRAAHQDVGGSQECHRQAQYHDVFHCGKVGGEARQQVARTHAAEKVHRLPLQVAVHADAEIVKHLPTQPRMRKSRPTALATDTRYPATRTVRIRTKACQFFGSMASSTRNFRLRGRMVS